LYRSYLLHQLIAMKDIILILFISLVFSVGSHGQVLETKNWCLSRCDLVGDERENTELVYLKLKKDSIIHINNQDSIIRIPLRSESYNKNLLM